MDYIPGEKFHNEIKKVYSEELKWAINKKSTKMAKVVYEAPHENTAYNDERRGKGKDYATWVFSEEERIKENIFTTGLELMIDATLEPYASVGLHFHDNTEEVYYILDGEINMTTVDRDGKEFTELLTKGDAHAVKKGQGHYGAAGSNGVRFITVAFK